jgi:hypothetical protein
VTRKLAIGDDALGFWKALAEIFPATGATLLDTQDCHSRYVIRRVVLQDGLRLDQAAA